MNERVVLVLADPGIRRLLRRCLCARGYTVVDLAGGSELDQVMKRHTVHVVVLDDLAWCSPFRLQWPQVPLLIISPVAEEREKVRALDLGADDYLTQPFDQEEFLARLRAHRRRARMQAEGVFWTPESEVLRSQDGLMTLDVVRRLVHVGQQVVHLSPQECSLLWVLMLHQGRVVSHQTLLQRVWGSDYADEANYLHVYMSQLRRKVEPEPAHPRYLLTCTRIGYVFQCPDMCAFPPTGREEHVNWR